MRSQAPAACLVPASSSLDWEWPQARGKQTSWRTKVTAEYQASRINPTMPLSDWPRETASPNTGLRWKQPSELLMVVPRQRQQPCRQLVASSLPSCVESQQRKRISLEDTWTPHLCSPFLQVPLSQQLSSTLAHTHAQTHTHPGLGFFSPFCLSVVGNNCGHVLKANSVPSTILNTFHGLFHLLLITSYEKANIIPNVPDEETEAQTSNWPNQQGEKPRLKLPINYHPILPEPECWSSDVKSGKLPVLFILWWAPRTQYITSFSWDQTVLVC